MKKLYVLLAIVFASFSVQAQLGVDTFTLGEDDTTNYLGANFYASSGGTGFSDWLFDNSTPNGGFSGRFIGSFSGDLDTNGAQSFGLFANSGNNAASGATKYFPKSLEEGDSFTASVGVNFRDGNKGFDLRDTGLGTIINFNVTNDEYNLTGTPGLYGNAYDSNTVITFTFTQNATDVSWTAVRSGGLTGTQSGTIGGISPGTIDNVRFYNVSAGTNGDGGAGQRNLFFNSLEFNSTYTIAGNSTVSVSGDTTAPYLDIQTGSTVNMPSTSNLTVSGLTTAAGALNMTSTSTAYPSLITNGGFFGIMTYNRYVNSNILGNDLISPPVEGQTWGSFLDPINATALLDDGGIPTATYAFAPFDKLTGDFENFDGNTSATLTGGTGYRVATDAGETLAFTGGQSPTTITTVGITNSGPAFEEWNLIGNPYPAYLNVQDFLNNTANAALLDETNVGIYGYDGDASNGWTIYNLANTSSTTAITPGQGFFVAAEADGDIEFNTSMKRIGTTDDFISGRNAELVYLMLQLNSGSKNYKTDFYVNANASLGLDNGYDAGVWSGIAPEFALYSHLVENNTGNQIALQSIGTADINEVTIPLGVNATQGEQLRFSILESTLPGSIEVYLEDMVANTSTLLNDSDYVITPTTALSGTGRFFLRTSEDALSTIENSLDTLNIFALNNSKELVVSGQLQGDTQLNLYDIQGRIVMSAQLDSTQLQNRIDVSSLSAGAYIVNVQNNTQQKSQKVIIK